MVAAGIQAAITRKARRTSKAVRYSHDWAVTMTKWLITKANRGVRWQIVEFLGPSGGESTGIVDLIAIRKDHCKPSGDMRRGDCFEIILLQVKGGNAGWPTPSDVGRLRHVAKHHRAKCVVLAEWKKGTQPSFYRLSNRTKSLVHPRQAWAKMPAIEIFG
jgi:hypothetical protein